MDEFKRKMQESLNEFKEKAKMRQEYNYKCLDVLKEMIEKYPDWRFTQILFNVGLAEDRFHEESIDTYEMLEKLRY